MQLAEINALVADDTVVDDISATAQDARPEHVEDGTHDRSDEDEEQDEALAAEQPGEATDRGAEVLRSLGRHAGRHPATGGPGLRRGQVRLVVFLFGRGRVADGLLFVDGCHAASSSSPICDCTISAYVGHVSIRSSWVPAPTSRPSSRTRMLSAVEIVDTRWATMTTAAFRVWGTRAARSRASVVRSSAENESSNT